MKANNIYSTSSVLIIGAGAAGILTAIAAASHGASQIEILDSTQQPGQKILMSGGGRCNVTNAQIDFEKYRGESPRAVRKVILQFPPQKILQLLEEEGVLCKVEKPWNKCFPDDNSARSILDALFARLHKLGLSVVHPMRVNNFYPQGDRWVVLTEKQTYLTDNLVLASGGFSYPHTGSDGALWKVLNSLGISQVEASPALTPLKTGDADTKKLSGISLWAELSVIGKSKPLFREQNSILFTHNGLSGPGILNASEYFTKNRCENNCRLEISFIPHSSPLEFERELLKETSHSPTLKITAYLAQFIPKRLSQILTTRAGIASKNMGELKKAERKILIALLFRFTPQITGHFGYKKAEVTAGGIPFSQLDIKTMRIKKYTNLYAVGEIVNVHGAIGGYNFQWAWSSGFVCGKALGEKVKALGKHNVSGNSDKKFEDSCWISGS